MTTYYVGIGGNDGSAGTSWATRKLTLNGAEDIPVAAADTVYVGPGTYRELLTVDVSGTTGNPITYIGDYDGSMTDGVGGVVRITGSDNDQTATRANCISSAGFNYRTFQGFTGDMSTGNMINLSSNCTNWIIQQCNFSSHVSNVIQISGTGGAHTIQNCLFLALKPSLSGIIFTHSSVYDNSANTVQNCVFVGAQDGILITRVGGITVKNSIFMGIRFGGVRVGTAITVGQTETVNNCIFTGCITALQATVAGEIVENYNTFWNNDTNRTNTNTGANSITYPPLFDTRWFFELAGGKGRMLSPFDLASYSQLVNLAGTSPTTTDMRGTAVIGAQREWGVLEYDPALLFRRVIGRQV